MITPTIYDWPSGLRPATQLFRAGGQAREGGFTTQGALVAHPELGGRAALEMTFGHMLSPASARLASWVFSKADSGAVFRVPITRSAQLVDANDLGIHGNSGLPWDNDQPWDNGQNWAAEILAEASGAAAAGTTVLTIDMAAYERVLGHGHVIGHSDRAYHVDDIKNDGAEATVTVSPPLRVAVANGDLITFRPRMLCTIQDVGSFRAQFEPPGYLLRPGSVTLIEALI